MQKTDRAWEYYGATDPYFGVLADDKYRRENLDDHAKSAFFALGDDYVEKAFAVVRGHLDDKFSPARALDFGCGVGRLTLPLARRCQAVVGVDVSDSMLAEAANNVRQEGLSNIELLPSDDTLSGVQGTFDLIHSFIVLQHIPRHRGKLLISRLVERLEEGGVGILQVTYANSTTTPVLRRAVTAGYTWIPLLHSLRNLVKGAPFWQPPLQMNIYDMNWLLRLLQEAGCHEIHLRFTQASSFRFPVYGVMLYFAKKRLDLTTHH